MKSGPTRIVRSRPLSAVPSTADLADGPRSPRPAVVNHSSAAARPGPRSGRTRRHFGPNTFTALVKRTDLGGPPPEDHEVVGDDSSGGNASSVGVRETQPDLADDPTPVVRLVADLGEDLLVLGQPVRSSDPADEPKALCPAAGCPDEIGVATRSLIHRRLLSKIRSASTSPGPARRKSRARPSGRGGSERRR